MIGLRTKRTGRTVPLAALLLVLQALGGGLVPLAHASEHFSAPAHIEAHHSAGCLALHDELRCALCHYAGSHVVRRDPRGAATAVSHRVPPRPLAAAPRASGADHLTAPPRAPPASRS